MRLAEAVKVLRENTMACWWPNGPYPGKRGTDIQGIAGEVRQLLQGIRERQNLPGRAGTYIYELDEANPETALHDQLVDAILTFTQAAGVNRFG